jgi:hypothetical protein
MMQSLEYVRLLLEAETKALLRIELRQEMWDYFLDEGHVLRVQKGEKTVGWLADRVVAALTAAGQGARMMRDLKAGRRLSAEQNTQGERQKVLSFLLAQKAAEDPQVVTFRQRVLQGRLLSLQEVALWIQQQATRDGPPTAWLEVPVPKGTDLRRDPTTLSISINPTLTIAKVEGVEGPRFRRLEYRIPGDNWIQSLSTAAGRVLEQLRVLSGRLTRQYPWQPYAATLFVLTGENPPITEISGSISAERGGRITLEIDPVLTPRQVAEAYRRFRRRVLGGKRLKTLSPKHLRLAAFVAERPEAETWQERMEAWNRAYPDWKYAQESNFRRDTGVAQKRQLTPSISWEQVLTAFAESSQTETSQ